MPMVRVCPQVCLISCGHRCFFLLVENSVELTNLVFYTTRLRSIYFLSQFKLIPHPVTHSRARTIRDSYSCHHIYYSCKCLSAAVFNKAFREDFFHTSSSTEMKQWNSFSKPLSAGGNHRCHSLCMSTARNDQTSKRSRCFHVQRILKIPF